MSGEDLRRCCIYNQVENLKEFLILRANPCSADTYGLTPLHYAIWNGHVDCVKYLIMNPHGITKDRERTSCINLRSSMGYTPLHLVALECPLSAIKECLFSLLLSGADPKIVDEEGKNVLQVAKEKQSKAFLDAFQEFLTLQKESKEQLKQYQKTLKKNYRVIPRRPGSPSPTKRDKRVHDDDFASSRKDADEDDGEEHDEIEDDTTARQSSSAISAKSTRDSRENPVRNLPIAIQTMIKTADHSTKIIKPPDLQVHEQILPQLTQTSFVHLQGIDSMKSLSFVKEEALKNIKRREKLVQQSDTALPDINLRSLSELVDPTDHQKKKRK